MRVSYYYYRQTSNIRRTLVGNKIVDNSDVFGASPVGAASSTSSFSTLHLASVDWAKTTAIRGEKHLSFVAWCDLYKRLGGICWYGPWVTDQMHIEWITEHYNDVIMSAIASQITSLMIVYSTVYSRRRSKKSQSSASLAFVREIHRGPVNSPHKGPVTRKIMTSS